MHYCIDDVAMHQCVSLFLRWGMR